jgi:hypothetical protein
MAVKDGRLVAVGTTADVIAQCGSSSDVVDLQGRFVTPVCAGLTLHASAGTVILHSYVRCKVQLICRHRRRWPYRQGSTRNLHLKLQHGCTWSQCISMSREYPV